MPAITRDVGGYNLTDRGRMASWLVKALLQRSIAALPNPHFWNELLQDRVTHSLDLGDELFSYGMTQCQKYLRSLQRYDPDRRDGFSVFELGTGWYPVVPIGMFLAGAREIWTWDLVEHLKLPRLKVTLDRFLSHDQTQRVQDYLNPYPQRLTMLADLRQQCESAPGLQSADLLERLGIHYRIGNAGQSGLPAQSVNLIFSNGVFEYLTPETLSELLREFRRIASPDAVMSHTIDLADQYASFDSRITHFNFLRFSDRLWRWLNNPIVPLNRLRISDYRRAFVDSGFEIVDEVNRLGDPSALAGTPLSERFRSYSVEDLLVLHSELLAVPAESAPLRASAAAC